MQPRNLVYIFSSQTQVHRYQGTEGAKLCCQGGIALTMVGEKLLQLKKNQAVDAVTKISLGSLFKACTDGITFLAQTNQAIVEKRREDIANVLLKGIER